MVFNTHYDAEVIEEFLKTYVNARYFYTTKYLLFI